jgi:alpha-1,6-mannosyltransferase
VYGSGRGGVAGLTRTVPGAPRLVSPDWLPAPKSRPGILGWVAATDIAISLLLMILVCMAGPSLVVPAIPRTWPIPPLWFPLHLSQATSVTLIYFAIVLGGVGVACGLVAVRRGARPNLRLLAAGVIVAIIVLALLPPGGSTDSLSYAAYGRIALIGHNPYVMTPAQLRAIGDPVGLQTTRNWQTDPSLYGPVSIAVDWAAAKVGGITISYIAEWLKLVFAIAFGVIALVLDRLFRSDPAARARAHLLWTVNPLMLWAVVGGDHIDGLGAGLGILGLLVARTAAAGPGARIPPARALAAGLLVGAAIAIKAPYLPLGLALAWSCRNSVKATAAAGIGGGVAVVPGYLIAGPAALKDLLVRSSNLVTFDSFWRLFYPPFGYDSMPRGLELFAAAGCVVVAALLAWRLPAGPPHLPAIRPAIALMLAWLLVWPLQRPWYDAIAFCLLAVVPAARLDWLMLIRAVPTALAMSTGPVGRSCPMWLTHTIGFVGSDLSPWIRLGTALAAVILCVLGAWTLRQPRAERPAVEAAALT